MSPRISLKRNVARQRDVDLLKIGIFVNFCSLFDWQMKPFIQERKRILAASDQTSQKMSLGFTDLNAFIRTC